MGDTTRGANALSCGRIYELLPELAKHETQAMKLFATSLGPIHGDAFHPALLVLGSIAAVAIVWIIWEFWFRDKKKG
jgi:hypothetical protein